MNTIIADFRSDTVTRPSQEMRQIMATAEVGDEICRRLYESEGDDLPESVRKICQDADMPSRPTVAKWLKDHEDFLSQYARARELRKDALTDRMMMLSRTAINNATGGAGTGEAGARIQATKIEIDSIKWILSKEYRHDYGDVLKTENTTTTKEEITLSPEAILQMERVRGIKAKIPKPEYKQES